MEKTKLQWHPAFGAALRITLQDEMQYLEMHEEYLLSKKPLQMDILIIKKLQDIKIKKTIGRIYPGKLLRHLETVRGMRTEYQGGGIYYLRGDPIPMQLLITPRMSDKENYWIQSMRTDLRAGEEIRKLMREYEKHKKSKDYAAVMNLITRANWEQMEVEKKMCDALNELFAEELKEADNKGRTEGRREMIFAFLKAGVDIKTIKEASGLNEEQIEEIRRDME